MAVTVLIAREFKKDSLPKALEIIVKIRSLATLEQGYISGQTMVSLNNANRIVVMSTWESLGRWQDWQDSELRKDYTARLDPLTVSLEQVDVLMVLV